MSSHYHCRSRVVIGNRGTSMLLLGLTAVLACGGCDQQTSSGNHAAPPPKSKAKDEKAAAAAPPKPYLEGWKTPAAALLLSGEIHGYLEPCGCSLKQSGGFARRAHLVKDLKKKKWPLAGLDSGGTLKKSNRQDQIKFESILTGMQELDYAAMALGKEELLLGPELLVSQHVPDDPKSVTFLGANVVLFGAQDIGTPKRWKIVKVGDVKIGVTSVLGLSHKEEVSPAGVNNDITLLDPIEVLPDVIKEMQAQKPDFLVLLSHGTVAEAKKLAEDFPPFRIILTAGGPDEASGKPIIVKDTMIIETGTKGRSVGVLGYYPQNADKPFRFELIELDSDRFSGEDERMTAIMRNYQQRLQDERIAQSDKLKLPDPPGGPFVGVETCGECHKKAFNHWKDTGHAKATDTLLHGRGTEKEWVPRQFDPECLSCHVTGWEPQQMKRFESGYFSLEDSKHLFGQQCENCHGPGGKHTEIERAFAADSKSVSKDELENLREAVRRSVKTAEKKVCAQCHDPENSPNFVGNFDEYWEQVKHPGKD